MAARTCPSLAAKHVTAHTLRHTAAMRLLLAGNDITVIALWLGHEQISTTNIYLHADMSHKQRAIERTRPLGSQARPLPAPRRPPRLPGGPLIMPTSSDALTPAEQDILPTGRHNPKVGIIMDVQIAWQISPG